MRESYEVKPGCWIYVLGAFFFLVGLAVGTFSVVKFVSGMTRMTDNLQQIKAPGAGTVNVKRPGRIVIYHEWQSNLDGRQYNNSGGWGKMSCKVKDDNGNDIAVDNVKMNENYSLGNRSGVAVWQFDAPAAGKYTVETKLPRGGQGEYVLAVGPSVMKDLLPTMGAFFVGLFCGLGGFVIGLILVVVGLVMRSRSKAKLQTGTV